MCLKDKLPSDNRGRLIKAQSRVVHQNTRVTKIARGSTGVNAQMAQGVNTNTVVMSVGSSDMVPTFVGNINRTKMQTMGMEVRQ